MGNSESANSAENVRKHYPVHLNVYKPLPSGDKLSDVAASTPGLGVYHSGVEVHGAGGETRTSGIYSQRPKWQPKESPWQYSETVLIGETEYTKDQIHGILEEMKREYPMNSYDITAKNCNHFADDFCKRICGKGIPGWVNRVAKVGNAVKKIVGGDLIKEQEEQAPSLAPLNAVVEFNDLIGDIDVARIGCLNQKNEHPISGLFQKQATGVFSKKKEIYLESDVDEQLLMFIPFTKNVKIHSIHISGPSGFAPKTIKFYVNKKDLDFDSLQSLQATQTIELTPKHVEGEGEPFQTKYVNFQNVSNLAVFIENNQGKQDITRISKISFIGLSS